MTHEFLLGRVVGQAARDWFNTRIKAPNVWALDRATTFDLSNDKCAWETTISVSGLGAWYDDHIYTVGGAMTDLGDIYPNIIWDADRKVVWMASASGRAAMGITTDFWL